MNHLQHSKPLRTFFSVVFSAVFFGAAIPAYADVIVLYDGNVLIVDRVWIEGDDVKYETSRGVQTIPRSRVRQIQEEKPTAPPPSSQKWSLGTLADSGSAPASSVPSGSANSISNATLSRLRGNLRANPADSVAKVELIQALNSVALLELSQGNLPGAQASLEEALDLDRRNTAILANLAIIHLRAGRYRSAEDLLRDGIDIDRENPDLYYLLGESYYRQEKIDQAITEWTSGLKLGPYPEMSKSLDKARQEASVHDELGALQSAHFILRYDRKVPNSQLGQQILLTLERLYAGLTRDLVSRPPATIAVILYPDQAYFDITRAASWSGALFDGKIRVPTKGLTGVTPELTATLTHELTHSFLDSLPVRCPTWFNEGIAQLEEGQSSARYRATLGELRQTNRLIPLKDLEGSFLNLPSAAAEIAYAEGLSAVEYMIARYGRGSVRSVLDLMAQNYNFDNAMKTALRQDSAEFEAAWKQTLRP